MVHSTCVFWYLLYTIILYFMPVFIFYTNIISHFCITIYYPILSFILYCFFIQNIYYFGIKSAKHMKGDAMYREFLKQKDDFLAATSSATYESRIQNRNRRKPWVSVFRNWPMIVKWLQFSYGRWWGEYNHNVSGNLQEGLYKPTRESTFTAICVPATPKIEASYIHTALIPSSFLRMTDSWN